MVLATAREEGADKAPDLKFVARFGKDLVDQGIVAFPGVLLRWQKSLQLSDSALLTAIHIFQFYVEKGRWPSVSMRRLATWRGMTRDAVEASMRELEALGYLQRPGRDPNYFSYYCDLTGLMRALSVVAEQERAIKALALRQAALRAGVAELVRASPPLIEHVTEHEIANAKDHEVIEDYSEPVHKGRAQSNGQRIY